ncbi:MAG: FAD-dependent oxidoreductase [Acidimicrobiales bacterium]
MSSDQHEADVIVVGAGPAGSAAALVAARSGLSVILLERGPFPGSKNMYGGVVYGRILDDLVPQWYDEMPIQRWVTRRSTGVRTEDRALIVDYRTQAWGRAPYNGATTYRPDFDSWLAGKAVEAGARLVTSTTATELLLDGGRIVGVDTDRPDGRLRAPVVIACDGVNSFLAKEAGLYHHSESSHFTLGAKETLALPKSVIDERFGVRDLEGVDIEIIGATQGIPGGGFVYTNLDSVAVGVVVGVDGLAEAGLRPEELIARLKLHPAIAPLIEGAELKEYSAHIIPEGGYKKMPELATDGMMVAGDAACMTLAAGIWLEGVNFAIGSGALAGEVAVGAHARNDFSARSLGRYRSLLEQSFVLADHRRLQDAPDLILSDRVQRAYPALACDLAEQLFTVTNPTPKPGVRKLLQAAARSNGVKFRHVVKDGLRGLRVFG